MIEEFVSRIRGYSVESGQTLNFGVASEAELERTETDLGFRLPQLLRSLYLNVANGGFGPGYDVIGIGAGHRSDLGDLVEAYHQVSAGTNYLGRTWKMGLLPFCGWGCNLFSCVDCVEDVGLIYLSEECVPYMQKCTLKDFFEKWIAGASILDSHRSRGRSVKGINPFTKREMTFRAARRSE